MARTSRKVVKEMTKFGKSASESMACEFSAGHCNRWVSTESRVKLEPDPTGGLNPRTHLA